VPLRKIVYIIGELGAGGAERQLHLLLRCLDRTKVEPLLVVWNLDPSQELHPHYFNLDIRILSISRRGGRLGRLISFLALMWKERPDYIHSIGFHTNFAAWLAHWIPGIKGSLGGFQSDYFHEVKKTGRIVGKLCARYPKTAISNSSATIRTIESLKTLWKPKNIYHFENSVEAKYFDAFQRLERTSASSNPVVQLVGVGRLNGEKRWENFVEVLSKFKIRHPEISWHCRILGEGVTRPIIEARIKELKMEKDVELVGFVDNVEEGLRQGDIFVFYSEFEGSPNVVSEAMAVGLPVISTPAGDLPDVIRNGQNGYLADDPNEYIRILAKLCKDSELRRRLGAAGRETMYQSRSAETLWDRLASIYDRVGWLPRVGTSP